MMSQVSVNGYLLCISKETALWVNDRGWQNDKMTENKEERGRKSSENT